MKRTFYITTPIYYASGRIHIGHAYCSIMADIIARYKKDCGYDVYFLTGADEHGQKIAGKAKAENLSPQEYVDKISDSFKANWKDLKIKYDQFIRTSSKKHEECVQKVFERLLAQGDIYKSTYSGWYCTPCESFWTETQVGEEHLCPDCHRPVHKDEEESYFLNVKKYVPQLLKFYEEHPNFVPGGKLEEMINTFIKPGLEDLCITRTSFSWGVPVKSDPKHVVYVWIDALLNYLSALGYLSEDDTLFQKYWSKDTEVLQLAGREINRFHTIYWPILLFALNLRCPDTVYIHGLLLTRSGVKLSKSLGNAPSPQPIIERYGLDALRYYDASEVKFGEDGTFTPNQFIDRINADLVNNYGNLVNRTLGMMSKYTSGIIPMYNEPVLDETKKLLVSLKEDKDCYFSEFDKYNVTKALQYVAKIGDLGNKYIDSTTPWILAKDPSKKKELEEVLYTLCEIIRTMSVLYKPVLVEKAQIALEFYNIPSELQTMDSLNEYGKLGGIQTNTGSPLFPRLDRNTETEFLVKLIDGE